MASLVDSRQRKCRSLPSNQTTTHPMSIIRYQAPSLPSTAFSPLARLSAFQQEADRFFDLPFVGRESSRSAGWTPALDLHQDKDSLFVHAELPGIKKEDVTLSLHDGVPDVLRRAPPGLDRRDEDDPAQRAVLRPVRAQHHAARAGGRHPRDRRLRKRHPDRDAAQVRGCQAAPDRDQRQVRPSTPTPRRTRPFSTDTARRDLLQPSTLLFTLMETQTLTQPSQPQTNAATPANGTNGHQTPAPLRASARQRQREHRWLHRAGRDARCDAVRS